MSLRFIIGEFFIEIVLFYDIILGNEIKNIGVGVYCDIMKGCF